MYIALLGLGRELAKYTAQISVRSEQLPTRDSSGLPLSKGGSGETETPLQEELELEIEDDFEPRCCPPCGTANAGKAVSFNGHSLLAARVLGDPSGTVLFCSTCGCYCSESQETRSRPEGLLEECKGAVVGSRQRARLQQRKFPNSGDDRRLDEPVGPSAWQLWFLERHQEQQRQHQHTEPETKACDIPGAKLSKADILSGFGLTEETAALLAARAIAHCQDSRPDDLLEDEESDLEGSDLERL